MLFSKGRRVIPIKVLRLGLPECNFVLSVRDGFLNAVSPEQMLNTKMTE